MNTKGLRRDDIAPCAKCNRGLMHDQQITATRVKVTRLCADLNALRQQHGLELMMGSPKLAHVMGPDRELLVPLHEEETFLVCDQCMLVMNAAELWELKHADPVPAKGGA